MPFAPFYDARGKIVDILTKDLLGPVEENEVIHVKSPSELPSKYYSMGILFPQKVAIDPEETEKDLTDSYGEKFDASINLMNSFRPSSMALSCTVKPGTDQIRIDVKYAWYAPLDSEHVGDPTDPAEEPGQNVAAQNVKGTKWKRFSAREIMDVKLGDDATDYPLKKEGLLLQIIPYAPFKDGSRTLTVALVNRNKGTMSTEEISRKSFFQPRILISSVGPSPVIIEKKMRFRLHQDEETINLELLHRRRPVFAVGHGCSVGWKASVDGKEAVEVYTAFIPQYELKQMKPVDDTVSQEVLSQQFLSQNNVDAVCRRLSELPQEYKRWIKKLREDLNSESLEANEKRILWKNLDSCACCREIIESSIDLLRKEPLVFRAFKLANQAMLEQRLRFLKIRGKNPDPKGIRWYPFQLAFFLQEIPSIANDEDPNRKTVDLLWFPTGGGKTEAYLGLIAFTIFLRRLRAAEKGENGAGVTAIMRYTLRLLTLQQFQRASLLICACESIRRSMPDDSLGKEEISIGLWVGESMTPTRLRNDNGREGEDGRDAASSLKKVQDSGYDSISKHNPCQIRKCPWCGEPIRPLNYSIESDGRQERMVIRCPSKDCEFCTGLPLYLIDEDIYNRKPSLIISTIDKFARMTREPRVKNIFNIGSNYSPPNLIIQDELHLISGPLGTISALYELAIRKMCTFQGRGPKIIASTATIQNAMSQVRNLYNQKVRQFPPHGTDIRDSFFARESELEEKPGRLYCGILAPSISPTSLLVRVYASLLFASRCLAKTGCSDDVVDNYWTLVGYFNSLRELGGAVIQILDDVQDRLEYLSKMKFAGVFPECSSGLGRYDNYRELNSRSGASSITESLELLEIAYPDPAVLDEVLATNMISVGVDVGRLGMMVVEGQPKTNAEYIQATSRVGRKNPGLVVTLYNAGRSRDRSHYEQFTGYHGALNRHVESTSLTPFSARARERALHAAFIGMCRCLVPELEDNGDADRFDSQAPFVREFRDWIVNNAGSVDDLEKEATAREIDALIRAWADAAGSNLKYVAYGNGAGKHRSLLAPADQHRADGIPTLNSMRNVDVESGIYLEG